MHGTVVFCVDWVFRKDSFVAADVLHPFFPAPFLIDFISARGSPFDAAPSLVVDNDFVQFTLFIPFHDSGSPNRTRHHDHQCYHS